MTVQHLGICQWFHFQSYEDVDRVLEMLDDLGVTHLRTNFSWADYARTGGEKWYDWFMGRLKDSKLDVLLCVDYTPPQLSQNGRCNGPPKNLSDYPKFLWIIFDKYDEIFQSVQFGTEVNNFLFWDFLESDPGWLQYAELVKKGARVGTIYGKTTVLGGMSPIDHNWLELMFSLGALEEIDVVAIHGFSYVPWSNIPAIDQSTWQEKINYISPYLRDKKLWVTETGYPTLPPSTENGSYDTQKWLLREANAAPVERLYWYTLEDLAPYRDAIEGYWKEPVEYMFGLATYRGFKKPAYEVMRQLQRQRK